MTEEKIFSMSSLKVYSCLLAKAERKGRTKEELDKIITWLTGYSEAQLTECLQKEIPYGQFFDEAPAFNPASDKIKGSICGMRIEEIDNPLMKKIRILDKLVDELAKGIALDNILRK